MSTQQEAGERQAEDGPTLIIGLDLNPAWEVLFLPLPQKNNHHGTSRVKIKDKEG